MRPHKSNLEGYSLYVIVRADERFKLKKGDVFIGAPYTHDTNKTSVGFRLLDGFDPGCNQYNDNIRKLTADEVSRVIWKQAFSISTPAQQEGQT